MISRILEQEKALRQVLSMDRKTAHLVPTWQDLEVLESINKALAPLADFTDILSGEKYVTFSALIPLLKHIIDDVLQHDEEDITLTTDIKQQIIITIKSFCILLHFLIQDSKLNIYLMTTYQQLKKEYLSIVPLLVPVLQHQPLKVLKHLHLLLRKNTGKYF